METPSLENLVNNYEKRLIRRALEEGGNITEASKILKVKRTTLSMKMKRLNLTGDYFKQVQVRLIRKTRVSLK